MTLRAVNSPYTVLRLSSDMVYGLKFMVAVVFEAGGDGLCAEQDCSHARGLDVEDDRGRGPEGRPS